MRISFTDGNTNFTGLIHIFGTVVEMEHNKRQHPPFFKSVRNYFREYCNCSSIHGFRYFGEKRTYFERGWWFIVFSVTLAACVIAIREVYQKWVKSPVIVSFATRETPIYKIPFPAVTICPETKSKKRLYNHTNIIRKLKKHEELSERERTLYDYMGLVCNRHSIVSDNYKPTFDSDFLNELKHVNYVDSVNFCSYMGKIYNCSQIFKPILTDDGICFTFNMLDRSEIYRDNVVHYDDFHVMDNLTYKNWTMDDGYADSAGIAPYPHRALLAGAKNSLTVHLITNKSDIDHTCRESIQGFRVPLNQIVLGTIQPVMITTSDSVKLYNPKRRECYFPSERHLKYFKIYTSLNCKLECLSNFTLHQCGCVNFFMPRDNTTKICGIGKRACMHDAEELLQMIDLQKKIVPRNESTSGNETQKQKNYRQLPYCDCMPICTDLSYNVELSQNDWKWRNLYRSVDIYGTLPDEKFNYHLSRLTLYFKSSQFITSQRHELYGPTDFLANFGGLLGLFTGFSVLSLMEAIYFLTVRLCCNSRLYGYWAGQDS